MVDVVLAKVDSVTGLHSPISPTDPFDVQDAVTHTSLTSALSALASILAQLQTTLAVAGVVSVSNLPATQAVSAASLPLPTGAATEATLDRRFGTTGTPKKSVGSTIAAAATTDVIIPTSGKRVRVLWVSVIPSSDNTVANLVTVKYASTQTMYVGYAISHWEMFEGAVNEKVQIVTANVQTVAYTIHYEEF